MLVGGRETRASAPRPGERWRASGRGPSERVSPAGPRGTPAAASDEVPRRGLPRRTRGSASSCRRGGVRPTRPGRRGCRRTAAAAGPAGRRPGASASRAGGAPARGAAGRARPRAPWRTPGPREAPPSARLGCEPVAGAEAPAAPSSPAALAAIGRVPRRPALSARPLVR